MAFAKQLTFWDIQPINEENKLWCELYDLKESHHNLRRGLFTRHDFMKKELCKLQKEVTELRELITNIKKDKIIENIIFH